METENKKYNSPKWAFLVSFWGRNAKDVISWHADNHKLDRIGLLVYEQEDCGAFQEAIAHDIKTINIKPESFPEKVKYQEAILNVLQKEEITHIFLLGYQYLIRKSILEAFPNRIANIHPSLFPSFLGTKTAIQDALDYGVKVTGITTHVIDHRFDRGTILCQEPIRIKENDTMETLYPKFAEIGPQIILKSMQMLEE
ncbi:formyltransferase family protein [Flagellimonas oceanensis]|uniref:formyltransferase family protein n=1 Tax=Flagellimonas oceanensis TaxID=2499163 RepID=UPI003BAB5682